MRPRVRHCRTRVIGVRRRPDASGAEPAPLTLASDVRRRRARAERNVGGRFGAIRQTVMQTLNPHLQRLRILGPHEDQLRNCPDQINQNTKGLGCQFAD